MDGLTESTGLLKRIGNKALNNFALRADSVFDVIWLTTPTPDQCILAGQCTKTMLKKFWTCSRYFAQCFTANYLANTILNHTELARHGLSHAPPVAYKTGQPGLSRRSAGRSRARGAAKNGIINSILSGKSEFRKRSPRALQQQHGVVGARSVVAPTLRSRTFTILPSTKVMPMHCSRRQLRIAKKAKGQRHYFIR